MSVNGDFSPINALIPPTLVAFRGRNQGYDGKDVTPREGGRPMGEGYSMLGFVVIVILYAVIGLMAAAGTIVIARKIPGPKAEQIFYAMFLMMIATFYLAFAAYFEVATAWRVETAVVVAFVAIGLLGVRLPFALIVGYSLHGLWDLLHELQGAWSLRRFRAGPTDRDPARLRNLLCSLRLLHGGVFLYATRRVECRVEYVLMSVMAIFRQ
jgi:hypothetical protein